MTPHQTSAATAAHTDERCHWDGVQRVTQRHLRDCNASGCAGCEPCRREHCHMPRCSHHLRDDEARVCASCLGKLRTSLVRLVQLCGFAPVVAATYGIDSPAAALAGPVAQHAGYAARYAWAVHHRGLCRCDDCPDLRPVPLVLALCDEPEDCDHWACRRLTFRPTCPFLTAWLDVVDDERHPLWVLEGWDRLVAEHLGHHRSLRVTVRSAAAYLDANLTDLARLEDFAFDELAREIEGCVTHVEGVLLLRDRVQRGAPCPVCGKANLEKHWEAGDSAYDERNDAYLDTVGHWEDLWVCPNAQCHQTWTEEEYRAKVEGIYVQATDRLTAAQIASTYRVSEGSVRGWASKGKVRRRGKNHAGLTLYDVADTLAMRDRARTKA